MRKKNEGKRKVYFDLKKYRYENDKPITELAKEIGVARGYLYNFLKGKGGADAQFLGWLIEKGWLKSDYFKLEKNEGKKRA